MARQNRSPVVEEVSEETVAELSLFTRGSFPPDALIVITFQDVEYEFVTDSKGEVVESSCRDLTKERS